MKRPELLDGKGFTRACGCTGSALLVAALLLPHPASALTREVCTTTCSYTGIQAAIDDSADGDLVLVKYGSYYGNVDFKGKNVTLRSEAGAAQTRIWGTGSGSAVRFVTGEGPGAVLDGFTVTGGASDVGGGVRVNGASPTIVNCVIRDNAATVDGGGIHIANGAAAVRDCAVSGNTAPLGAGIYVAGAGARISGSLVTLNTTQGGAGAGAGIYLSNADASISSTTVSLNYAMSFGGGIYVAGSAPTINGCSVIGNFAGGYGGGLYWTGVLAGASGSLQTSTISANGALLTGGGIHVNASSPTISDCDFTNNRSPFGGGIYVNQSTSAFARCRITSNLASSYGGGVYAENLSSPVFAACLVSGNDAHGAGGLWIAGTATLVNTVVSGNRASTAGGGGLLVSGDASLTHCTVAGNAAATQGGGIHVSGGAVTARNSILWGDTAAGAPNETAVGAGSLTLTACDVQGGAGAGNVDLEPRFLLPAAAAPTAVGDYRLQSGSACIDRVAAGRSATDLEGDPRPQGARADIGADEVGRLANGYLEGTSARPAGWKGRALSTSDKRVGSPVRDGRSAFQFVGGAGDKQLFQTRAVSGAAGTHLVLRGWNKAQAPAAKGGVIGIELRVTFTDATARSYWLTFPRTTHDWVALQKSFRMPKAFKSARVALHYTRQRGKAWFDGVELLVK